MGDLARPLAPAPVASPIYRFIVPAAFPASPGFLSSMDADQTTVVALGAAVTVATPCYKGVVFGLENGVVGVADSAGDIREIAYESQAVTSLAAEGNFLSSYHSDGQNFRLWNLDTFEECRVPLIQTTAPAQLFLTPDGQNIVSSSPSGGLVIQPINSPQFFRLMEHSSEVSCATVSRFKRAAMSASVDGEVKVWSMEWWKCLHTFKAHNGKVNCLAFTSDYRGITGGEDGVLKVLDLAAGSETAVLRGHRAAVLCCAVTADNTRVISGSEDTEVRVWTIATARDEYKFTGHQQPVRLLYITPDSKYLLSASTDVLVCDLSNPQELACLRGHSAPLTSLCLTPDFSYIVSTSSDQTLRIWGRPQDHEPTVTKPQPAPIYQYENIPAPVYQYPAIPAPAPFAPQYPASSAPQYPAQQSTAVDFPLREPLTEPLLSREIEPNKDGLGDACRRSLCAICVTLVICLIILMAE